jgi:hypothetical protein
MRLLFPLSSTLRFFPFSIGFSALLILSQPASALSQFVITPDVAQLIRDGQQAMYSCDYESADRDFDTLTRLYPDHPAGYMYKAVCIWWRALRDSTNKDMQAQFFRHSQEGIAKGEALIKKDPKDFYAQMFLAGIYGNLTRFNVTITHQYLAAMRAGMKGDRYNRHALALRPSCVDCLIGTGSYYYAPEALPPLLRRFAAILGVRADLSRSIKDLEKASEQGEFTQTEAKIILLGIYYNEKWFDKYENLLLSLLGQYPSNHIFYLWLANFYIQQHQYEQGTRFFSSFLNKTTGNLKLPVSRGYQFLEKGRLELAAGAPGKAVSSFNSGISAAPEDREFLAQLHLLRGFALDLLSQRNSAIREYEAVLALPNVEETHKTASHFAKVPYQGGL